MVLNRKLRMLYVEAGGQAQDITLGEIIDGMKQELIEDLKRDPALVAALAVAVASHLTASVRPT